MLYWLVYRSFRMRSSGKYLLLILMLLLFVPLAGAQTEPKYGLRPEAPRKPIEGSA